MPDDGIIITPDPVTIQVQIPAIARVGGTPEVILQAVVIPGDKTSEGQIIQAVAFPWFAIYREIERDPESLFRFTKAPPRVRRVHCRRL